MTSSDFFFEYEHIPTPDAAERLSQAWDIIFALILEDYRAEQEQEGDEKPNLEREEC